MIQRFGRVNRKRKKGISEVFIFTRGSEQDKYIYDAHLVARTLDELADMNLLHEWLVQEATDTVYQEGFGKMRRSSPIRDRCLEMSSTRLFRSQTQIGANPTSELFNSVEAVPEFSNWYLDCIQDGDIYGAMAYTPAQPGPVSPVKGEGRISASEGMLFVDAVYDQHLGLLIERRDPGAFME